MGNPGDFRVWMRGPDSEWLVGEFGSEEEAKRAQSGSLKERHPQPQWIRIEQVSVNKNIGNILRNEAARRLDRQQEESKVADEQAKRLRD
jgi:hypothetical protein